MCRDDKRTLRHEGADGGEHLPGGCTIDACRGFIQQEDAWRCEQSTCDAQPAPLTPRERVPVFTQPGIQSLLEPPEQVREADFVQHVV